MRSNTLNVTIIATTAALLISLIAACESFGSHRDQPDIAPHIGKVVSTTHDWILCETKEGEDRNHPRLIVTIPNESAFCAKRIAYLPTGTQIRILDVTEKRGLGASGLLYVQGEVDLGTGGKIKAMHTLWAGWKYPPW
ncbi:MAG: hypothetical protein JNM52_06635 [Betaproteobacteria bacterium]|nr:hypothetical protein [Betaproteobacteria bacterium]